MISRAVAIATARTLIKRHPELNLDQMNIEDSSWSKSLFKRMGFKRRLATTGKVSMSPELHQEIQEAYLYSLVKKIEENDIPASLVLNLDQAPSKFVPGCNKTLAKKGSKTVSIAGSADKRMITATFVITLSEDFLPIQLIYGGKTKKSIPAVKFPDEFHVTANLKHDSNDKVSLEMMGKIIISYVEEERRRLHLSNSHPAVLIMDVFKGQMTDAVKKVLKENRILLEKVPAKTYVSILAPRLSRGIQCYVKRMIKNKFTLWYADQIDQALDTGTALSNIKVNLKFSTVKLLHAKWILEVYNHMTSAKGKKVCLKGWDVTGISDAVRKGLKGMAHIDPFHDIDPLAKISFKSEDSLEYERETYINDIEEEESGSEYEDNDGNIFNILEDDLDEDE